MLALIAVLFLVPATLSDEPTTAPGAPSVTERPAGATGEVPTPQAAAPEPEFERVCQNVQVTGRRLPQRVCENVRRAPAAPQENRPDVEIDVPSSHPQN